MSAFLSRCAFRCFLLVCCGCLMAGLWGCGTEDAAMAEAQTDQPQNAAPKQKPKAKQKADDPEAKLEADLDDAIKQLEAGHLAVFIERYMPITDLRRLRESMTVEDVAKKLKADGGFEKTLKMFLYKMRALKKGTIEFVGPDKSLAKITGGGELPKESNFSLSDPADEKIPTYGGYPGEVKQAIRQAIAALEKKDYEEFVQKFYPQSELQTAASKSGIEALEIRLKAHPEMAKRMIADLKSLEKQTPKLDAQETTATFELKVEAKKGKPIKRTIRFEKAETWRMADTAKEIRTKMYKQSQQPTLGVKAGLTTNWERIRDHWRLYKFE